MKAFFERNKELAPLFIRLIIGWHLLYGVMDNIVSYDRMLEFRDFLAAHKVIHPLFMAHLSVYAQLLCGICYLLGAFTRLTAVIMIINFIVALLVVHWGDTYPGAFPALMMLSASLFFLFNGAGKYSIDHILFKKM